MQKMKESGVNWIAKIPSDWSTQRIKYLFSFGKGLPITKANLIDSGLPVISYGQIHSKQNNGTEIKDSLLRYVDWEYKKLYPSCEVFQYDFIFADTSEDYEGCGNCVYKRDSKIQYAGYHDIVLHSKHKRDNRYLAYLFQTDCWRRQIRETASGVKVFSISQKTISNASVILPNIDAQRRIADFLDEKCEQIDSLTADIQSQIDSLEEYKKSVITEAVTKGLNPDVEMKDSGIEWIGLIPQNWNISRLKYNLSCPMKYGASETGVDYSDKLPRYIRITDITADNRLKDDGKLSLTFEQAKGYILNEETVLFARSGGTVGKTFLYTPDYGLAAFAGYLISGVTDKSKMLSKWLWYFSLSNAYWEWVIQIFTQSTIQNIGADKYSNLPLTVPDINTQKEIIEHLDGKCAEVDAIISEKKEQLSTLKEYKKSLIYEYVTGKKEVATT